MLYPLPDSVQLSITTEPLSQLCHSAKHTLILFLVKFSAGQEKEKGARKRKRKRESVLLTFLSTGFFGGFQINMVQKVYVTYNQVCSSSSLPHILRMEKRKERSGEYYSYGMV